MAAVAPITSTPSSATSSDVAFPSPVQFHTWIAEIRPTLAPPVGNKLLYGDGQQKVMVVGGPNAREDYHIEIGEIHVARVQEIFFQLEGGMEVKIFERGVARTIAIAEGEIFLLPGRIPHSPQRRAGTVGLVLERERYPGEIDGLRWYARDGSNRVLYEEYFHCTDLGVQLKPVIERFFAMDCYRTGVPDREFPPAPITLNDTISIHPPINFADWVAKQRTAHPHRHAHVLYGAGADVEALRDFEYTATVFTGPDADWTAYRPALEGELFVYQREGESTITVRDAVTGEERTHPLRAGDVMLIPGHKRFEAKASWGGVALVVVNSHVGHSA